MPITQKVSRKGRVNPKWREFVISPECRPAYRAPHRAVLIRLGFGQPNALCEDRVGIEDPSGQSLCRRGY
jgi:hypothetical protein